MAKAPGLFRRGNKWYLRTVIPKDLVKLYAGRTEIRKSLDTSEYSVAKQRANVLRVAMDATFDDLRETYTANVIHNSKPASHLSETHALSIVQKYVAEMDVRNIKSEARIYGLSEEILKDIEEENEIALDAFGDKAHPIGQKDTFLTAQKLIKKNELAADFSTEGFSEFMEMMRRGLLELSRRSESRNKQDFSTAYFDHLFAPDALVAKGPTLAKVCEGYFSEYNKISGVKEKRLKKVEAAIGLLQEYFGADILVESISRQNCRQFRDALNVIPPNAKKKFPKKSLSEVLDCAKETGLAALAYDTQIQYLSVLNQILEWASREDLIVKNPASGLKPLAKKPDSSSTREVFNAVQLHKIFHAPIYTGCLNEKAGYAKPGEQIVRGGRFWCALIALYTGMRENEICQLRVTDIGITEQGTQFIDNNTLDEGKSLKNANSRRLIPIHPELISIGLLEHVEKMKSKGESDLFPDLPVASTGYRSDNFSKWFNNGFLKKVGVKTKRNGFHSFRHTFTDAVLATEAPEEVIKRIAGWSDKKSMLYTYGDGHSLDHLAIYLSKVKYDIDLSFLHI